MVIFPKKQADHRGVAASLSFWHFILIELIGLANLAWPRGRALTAHGAMLHWTPLRGRAKTVAIAGYHQSGSTLLTSHLGAGSLPLTTLTQLPT